MLYLEVEDIVANSIIELNKLDGSTEVMIGDAKRYGEEVAKHLKEKKGYYTLLKVNPSTTESFETKYSNYFSKYYEGNSYGYRLVGDKTVEDIVSIFRSPLVLELVDSFTDELVIKRSFPGRGEEYSYSDSLPKREGISRVRSRNKKV